MPKSSKASDEQLVSSVVQLSPEVWETLPHSHHLAVYQASQRAATTRKLQAWKKAVELFQAGDRFGSFRTFAEGCIEITTKNPGEIITLRWNKIQEHYNRNRTNRDIVL